MKENARSRRDNNKIRKEPYYEGYQEGKRYAFSLTLKTLHLILNNS